MVLKAPPPKTTSLGGKQVSSNLSWLEKVSPPTHVLLVPRQEKVCPPMHALHFPPLLSWWRGKEEAGVTSCILVPEALTAVHSGGESALWGTSVGPENLELCQP